MTIPNSVKSIGDNAFYCCGQLVDVTVDIEEPISISEYTFSNRINATLTVPYGCKAAYEAADYWKEFKEIVELEPEVTDISQLDNAIYIEPFSARIGDEVNIEVRLKNVEAATSYGFDLVLPVGMSIATEADNSFDDAVTLSSRNSKHTTTTNKLSAERYKIGVASLSSKALTGNDGLVLTIKAQVADDMAVGDYAVTIENPLLVLTDGTKPAVEATATKVTIEDYVKGDVDGDGVVDLADAVLVINYYVGKTVNNFAAKAADVDGDGVIDLADAVKIINYYVGKIPSLSRGQKDEEHDPE